MLFSSENSLDEVFHAIRHELNRGALDSKHPFRFVSFATQGKEGPDVRYVVLRKIDKDLNFYFFTDARSTKVSQLKDDRNVTLLFYHQGKRIQIKVTGKAEIHIKNELSESFWSSVQGESKKAYNSVLAPGTIIANPEDAYLWSEEMDEEYFCLIKFSPLQVEGLQLNGLTHIRVQFKKTEIEDDKGKWSSVWLVP